MANGSCQVDGSGDCSDDMLKELYPDDDIPEDLIGFLDDKVTLSREKTGFYLTSLDLELGPKREKRERGSIFWKVAINIHSVWLVKGERNQYM